MLVLITAPEIRVGEASLLTGLLEAGAGPLHLRKPDATGEGLRELLVRLPAALRALLVIHHRRDLCAEFGCGGLHLRAEALDGGLPLPPSRCSVSVHAPAEIAACPPDLRYALFAPVFPSISKPGHHPAWDPSAVHAALARPEGPPVLALGGVTPARLPAVYDLGFAGAAVLGWFWRDDDVAAHLSRWHELEAAWTQCRRTCGAE